MPLVVIVFFHQAIAISVHLPSAIMLGLVHSLRDYLVTTVESKTIDPFQKITHLQVAEGLV